MSYEKNDEAVTFDGLPEDEMVEEPKLPEKEEVLMSEQAILDGMMAAARFSQEKENRRKIQIKREDKVFFEFWIRPLSEQEIIECVKKATKYYPNPNGRHLPKIEGETNPGLMRSLKLIKATVDSDKLWNNSDLKRQLNVLDPVDVVDAVLLAGEKDAIDDVIDQISGYANNSINREDYVKN